MIQLPIIPLDIATYATCLGLSLAFSVSIVSLIFRPIENMWDD